MAICVRERVVFISVVNFVSNRFIVCFFDVFLFYLNKHNNYDHITRFFLGGYLQILNQHLNTVTCQISVKIQYLLYDKFDKKACFNIVLRRLDVVIPYCGNLFTYVMLQFQKFYVDTLQQLRDI